MQHKIKENGDLLWPMLKNKNTYIFIAGNSKNMPKQVREAFIDICKINGGMALEDATCFIEDMEKNGHYQTETWS